MHNLKKLFLITILSLFLNPVHLAQGQDDMAETELEEEMQNQRADYQKILKNLKAEEFLENADITKLINSGEIDFDKIEETVRNLKKQQASKVYGKMEKPSMTSLMSGGAHEQIITMLAPLENVSEEKLKKNLTHNLKDGTIKRFIEGNENFKTFLVKIIKSKKALPQMALIVDKKNRLYIYVLVNIVIFVVFRLKSMISKRRNAANKYYRKKFSDGILGKLVSILMMMGLRIGIFIYFFHKEAEPTWTIFRQTML